MAWIIVSGVIRANVFSRALTTAWFIRILITNKREIRMHKKHTIIKDNVLNYNHFCQCINVHMKRGGYEANERTNEHSVHGVFLCHYSVCSALDGWHIWLKSKKCEVLHEILKHVRLHSHSPFGRRVYSIVLLSIHTHSLWWSGIKRHSPQRAFSFRTLCSILLVHARSLTLLCKIKTTNSGVMDNLYISKDSDWGISYEIE